MIARLLAVLATLLFLLIAADLARSRASTPPLAGPGLADTAVAGRTHRGATTATPLDSLARITVRQRLGGEPERHYLDSLLPNADSTIRRWSVPDGLLRITVLPGGPAAGRPEFGEEVRWALQQWNPARVGLRLLDEDDSLHADLIVRWTDQLDSGRAGTTDVTWDHSGRIKKASITLAVRDTEGRDLDAAERRAVALHEVGHALGLPHSSRDGDAMYPIATALELSDRDRFSLRLLYELPLGWVGERSRRRPVPVEGTEQ
jgi:hypothetical protein